MAKCTQCKGCYKTIWIDNKVYRYCTLCRLVYSVEIDKLTLVTDPKITNYIFSTREGMVI